MIILETDSLDKSYGPVHAVNQLSLTVGAGQVYGILGPNGSGKTTTLSMLMGIVRPNGGSFKWFGGETGFQQELVILYTLYQTAAAVQKHPNSLSP
jgi:ABC-2 type transport system ATP-binding protein